ncbi:unnamed protein product [Brassica oleracea]
MIKLYSLYRRNPPRNRKTLHRRLDLSVYLLSSSSYTLWTKEEPYKSNNKMNREKLMKMANTVRTGGKGTVRR